MDSWQEVLLLGPHYLGSKCYIDNHTVLVSYAKDDSKAKMQLHLVTYLNQRSIFEWCVVRCRSKNGHENAPVAKKLDYMLKTC